MTIEKILEALSNVQEPDLGKDLEEYSAISSSYWNAMLIYHYAKCASLKELEIPLEKLTQADFVYQKHLEKIFIKLEEHVEKK